MPRRLPRSHPFARRRRFIVRNTPAKKHPYFKDTFTDDDSTLISAHTPNINRGGNPYTGNGVIQSNELVLADTKEFYIDLGISDFILSVRFNTDSVGSTNYLYFRYKTAINFWRLKHRPADNSLKLEEKDAGVKVIRATQALTGHIDAWGTYTVTLNGTSIIGSFNYDDYGDAEVNYTSSLHQSETVISAQNDASCLLYIDDLEIVQ